MTRLVVSTAMRARVAVLLLFAVGAPACRLLGVEPLPCRDDADCPPDVACGGGTCGGDPAAARDAGARPDDDDDDDDAGIVDDGGVDDAGAADAGDVDGGTSADAGALDDAGGDAGVDAGFVDAGFVDAGTVDAGLLDGGLLDGGPGDAGLEVCPGVFAAVHTAPAPSGQWSSLTTDGTNLWYFTRDDGRLFRSKAADLADWNPRAPATTAPTSTDAGASGPGDMYGGGLVYWDDGEGGSLVGARWRDPTLPGAFAWDRDRAIRYHVAGDDWELQRVDAGIGFTHGFVVVDDSLFGIQHAASPALKHMDLGVWPAGVDEGAPLQGIAGRDPGWLSRVARLAVVGDRVFGVKNDRGQADAGVDGDRLFSFDPGAFTAGQPLAATDHGALPFALGDGAALVALPPFWTDDVGAAGGLFVIAGRSPATDEGAGPPSTLAALYDVETLSFTLCPLPAATGQGTSAAFFDGAVVVKRGREPVALDTTLWRLAPP